MRQKRRDKGKRHNLDDNTDFSNRSNLKRRDSCVQNFSLRYFHIEKKLRSESLTKVLIPKKIMGIIYTISTLALAIQPVKIRHY
ncbi:MAG: hypothetical protein D3922_13360, partial [Candidatus Electrothrix sp. AR1]|nr:hypothetical protein [Candidatus Electrothrix sp. AR1]